MGEKTIFDQIIKREIPADVVFEDDDVLAFKDINPQAPVHVLVIPKQKIVNFNQLAGTDPAYVGRYMQAIAKVANQLGLDEKGYRIVFNTGKNGQQTVNYIHAHILGERQMNWPPG